MTFNLPYLPASHGDFFWTLQQPMSSDFFSFQEAGAGSLLLIGMHLVDAMPWLCARNPVHLKSSPGLIDQEAKRILGKRFRIEEHPPLPLPLQKELDPFTLLLQAVAGTGHRFDRESSAPPVLIKAPGKLLPRLLTARATVRLDSQEFTLHARNFSEVSQCLHAELTLVFALSQMLSSMPRPPSQLRAFQLETTMKPCKMCAAFLHVLRGRCENFSVTYELDDPGRLAANTLLDRFGYQSHG